MKKFSELWQQWRPWGKHQEPQVAIRGLATLTRGDRVVLNPQQLRQARNFMERVGFPINYTKAQFGAAVQALDNAFEVTRATFSSEIDTATSPLVLSANQKRALFKAWLSLKESIE